MRRILSALLAAGTAAAAAHAQPPANTPPKPVTEDGGRPAGNNQNSRTAGSDGPVLLDNFQLLQKLARFDRERIPERVVHARGVGLHGEFVAAGDFGKFTKMKPLSTPGKTTPVFVRFSTVVHPNGSPEQLRDPRGFAVKFYTEEGNWDLVGNNMPVFFIRDAMKFPDFVHSFKPSPVTNQQDPNRQFDFLSHHPESTHMLTFLYSDQGTPANLRQMDGFGVHAFKWVNAEGEVRYVKFNWRSKQGLKRFTADEAKKSAGENQSALTKEIYDKVKAGDFPQWDLMVQMIPAGDLGNFDFDPLDATKIWTGVPEAKVGTMTLNRVPDNFFQFTEQVAFSPGMVVPGVEPSEDRLLQGRLFSYADTQRYRVGTNYLMLPVNRPLAAVSNNNQDGQGNFGDTKSDVNYEPSVTTGGRKNEEREQAASASLSGGVQQRPITKTLNFKQAGELYQTFTEAERSNLIKNLAGDLLVVKNEAVKRQMMSFFLRADAEYGTRLAKAVGVDLAEIEAIVKADVAAGK